MKKILVTGANGFLGQHLCNYLKNKNHMVLATGRGASRFENSEFFYQPMNLSDTNEVKQVISQFKPDIIIHNGAMSKPNDCFNDPQRCFETNVKATQIILENDCEHFLFISSDFVFGEGGPHAEMDEPSPLNYYGETKLKAETIVNESHLKTTIIRPVFIYGKVYKQMNTNFVNWVANNLKEGRPMKVTADQYRTPTYVMDICIGINNIIDLGAEGTYHLAGRDIITPYEMALTIAKLLKKDASLIEKVTAETFSEPVIRPKRGGLTIEKAIADVGYKPVTFEEGIRLTFDL